MSNVKFTLLDEYLKKVADTDFENYLERLGMYEFEIENLLTNDNEKVIEKKRVELLKNMTQSGKDRHNVKSGLQNISKNLGEIGPGMALYAEEENGKLIGFTAIPRTFFENKMFGKQITSKEIQALAAKREKEEKELIDDIRKNIRINISKIDALGRGITKNVESQDTNFFLPNEQGKFMITSATGLMLAEINKAIQEMASSKSKLHLTSDTSSVEYNRIRQKQARHIKNIQDEFEKRNIILSANRATAAELNQENRKRDTINGYAIERQFYAGLGLDLTAFANMLWDRNKNKAEFKKKYYRGGIGKKDQDLVNFNRDFYNMFNAAIMLATVTANGNDEEQKKGRSKFEKFITTGDYKQFGIEKDLLLEMYDTISQLHLTKGSRSEGSVGKMFFTKIMNSTLGFVSQADSKATKNMLAYLGQERKYSGVDDKGKAFKKPYKTSFEHMINSIGPIGKEIVNEIKKKEPGGEAVYYQGATTKDIVDQAYKEFFKKEFEERYKKKFGKDLELKDSDFEGRSIKISTADNKERAKEMQVIYKEIMTQYPALVTMNAELTLDSALIDDNIMEDFYAEFNINKRIKPLDFEIAAKEVDKNIAEKIQKIEEEKTKLEQDNKRIHKENEEKIQMGEKIKEQEKDVEKTLRRKFGKNYDKYYNLGSYKTSEEKDNEITKEFEEELKNRRRNYLIAEELFGDDLPPASEISKIGMEESGGGLDFRILQMIKHRYFPKILGVSGAVIRKRAIPVLHEIFERILELTYKDSNKEESEWRNISILDQKSDKGKVELKNLRNILTQTLGTVTLGIQRKIKDWNKTDKENYAKNIIEKKFLDDFILINTDSEGNPVFTKEGFLDMAEKASIEYTDTKKKDIERVTQNLNKAYQYFVKNGEEEYKDYFFEEKDGEIYLKDGIIGVGQAAPAANERPSVPHQTAVTQKEIDAMMAFARLAKIDTSEIEKVFPVIAKFREINNSPQHEFYKRQIELFGKYAFKNDENINNLTNLLDDDEIKRKISDFTEYDKISTESYLNAGKNAGKIALTREQFEKLPSIAIGQRILKDLKEKGFANNDGKIDFAKQDVLNFILNQKYGAGLGEYWGSGLNGKAGIEGVSIGNIMPIISDLDFLESLNDTQIIIDASKEIETQIKDKKVRQEEINNELKLLKNRRGKEATGKKEKLKTEQDKIKEELGKLQEQYKSNAAKLNEYIIMPYSDITRALDSLASTLYKINNNDETSGDQAEAKGRAVKNYGDRANQVIKEKGGSIYEKFNRVLQDGSLMLRSLSLEYGNPETFKDVEESTDFIMSLVTWRKVAFEKWKSLDKDGRLEMLKTMAENANLLKEAVPEDKNFRSAKKLYNDLMQGYENAVGDGREGINVAKKLINLFGKRAVKGNKYSDLTGEAFVTMVLDRFPNFTGLDILLAKGKLIQGNESLGSILLNPLVQRDMNADDDGDIIAAAMLGMANNETINKALDVTNRLKLASKTFMSEKDLGALTSKDENGNPIDTELLMTGIDETLQNKGYLGSQVDEGKKAVGLFSQLNYGIRNILKDKNLTIFNLLDDGGKTGNIQGVLYGRVLNSLLSVLEQDAISAKKIKIMQKVVDNVKNGEEDIGAGISSEELKDAGIGDLDKYFRGIGDVQKKVLTASNWSSEKGLKEVFEGIKSILGIEPGKDGDGKILNARMKSKISAEASLIGGDYWRTFIEDIVGATEDELKHYEQQGWDSETTVEEVFKKFAEQGISDERLIEIIIGKKNENGEYKGGLSQIFASVASTRGKTEIKSIADAFSHIYDYIPGTGTDSYIKYDYERLTSLSKEKLQKIADISKKIYEYNAYDPMEDLARIMGEIGEQQVLMRSQYTSLIEWANDKALSFNNQMNRIYAMKEDQDKFIIKASPHSLLKKYVESKYDQGLSEEFSDEIWKEINSEETSLADLQKKFSSGTMSKFYSSQKATLQGKITHIKQQLLGLVGKEESLEYQTLKAEEKFYSTRLISLQNKFSNHKKDLEYYETQIQEYNKLIKEEKDNEKKQELTKRKEKLEKDEKEYLVKHQVSDKGLSLSEKQSQQIEKFKKDLANQGYKVVGQEVLIPGFLGNYGVSGIADLLLYNKEKNSFMVADYKTNAGNVTGSDMIQTGMYGYFLKEIHADIQKNGGNNLTTFQSYLDTKSAIARKFKENLEYQAGVAYNEALKTYLKDEYKATDSEVLDKSMSAILGKYYTKDTTAAGLGVYKRREDVQELFKETFKNDQMNQYDNIFPILSTNPEFGDAFATIIHSSLQTGVGEVKRFDLSKGKKLLGAINKMMSGSPITIEDENNVLTELTTISSSIMEGYEENNDINRIRSKLEKNPEQKQAFDEYKEKELLKKRLALNIRGKEIVQASLVRSMKDTSGIDAEIEELKNKLREIKDVEIPFSNELNGLSIEDIETLKETILLDIANRPDILMEDIRLGALAKKSAASAEGDVNEQFDKLSLSILDKTKKKSELEKINELRSLTKEEEFALRQLARELEREKSTLNTIYERNQDIIGLKEKLDKHAEEVTEEEKFGQTKGEVVTNKERYRGIQKYRTLLKAITDARLKLEHLQRTYNQTTNKNQRALLEGDIEAQEAMLEGNQEQLVNEMRDHGYDTATGIWNNDRNSWNQNIYNEAQRLNAIYEKVSSKNYHSQQGKNQIIQQTLLGNINPQLMMYFQRMFQGGVITAGVTMYIREVKKLINSSKELDKVLTNIRIVTNDTIDNTRNLVSQYSKLGKELGVTTKEVAQSGIEWMRQGYEAAEATDLIRASLYLSKLGMMDSTAATKSLTSALKGFKLEASEALDVVDKLTALDLKAATSAGDIAEGLSQFANLGSLSGVDIDQAAAYIATITDVTQMSGSSAGQAMKTILSRYGNVKAGAYEKLTTGADDEDAEGKLNDVERVLSKIGISIRETNLQFKDFDKVLAEIADKWITLDNVSKKAVANAFAGTRQQESFITLLENWDKYEELLETSRSSKGTATLKYKAQEESLEAAMNRLQSVFEDFVNKSDVSGILINIYDALTVLTEHFLPLLISYIPSIFAAIKNGVLFYKTFSNKQVNKADSPSKLIDKHMDKAAKSAEKIENHLAQAAENSKKMIDKKSGKEGEKPEEENKEKSKLSSLISEITPAVSYLLNQTVAALGAYMTSGLSHKDKYGNEVQSSKQAHEIGRSYVTALTFAIPFVGQIFGELLVGPILQRIDATRDEANHQTEIANNQLNILNEINGNFKTFQDLIGNISGDDIATRDSAINQYLETLYKSDNRELKESLENKLKKIIGSLGKTQKNSTDISGLLSEYQITNEENQKKIIRYLKIAQIQQERELNEQSLAAEKFAYTEQIDEARLKYENSRGSSDYYEKLESKQTNTLWNSSISGGVSAVAAGVIAGLLGTPVGWGILAIVAATAAAGGVAYAIGKHSEANFIAEEKEKRDWEFEQMLLGDQIRTLKTELENTRESTDENTNAQREATEAYLEALQAYQDWQNYQNREHNKSIIQEGFLEAQVTEGYLSDLTESQLKNYTVTNLLESLIEAVGPGQLIGINPYIDSSAEKKEITEDFISLALPILKQDAEINKFLSGSAFTLSEAVDKLTPEDRWDKERLQNFATALNVSLDTLLDKETQESLLAQYGLVTLAEMTDESILANSFEKYGNLLGLVTDKTKSVSEWTSEIISKFPDLVKYLGDTNGLMTAIGSKLNELNRVSLKNQWENLAEDNRFWEDTVKPNMFKILEDSITEGEFTEEEFEKIKDIIAKEDITTVNKLRRYFNGLIKEGDDGVLSFIGDGTENLYNAFLQSVDETLVADELKEKVIEISKLFQTMLEQDIQGLTKQRDTLQEVNRQREYENKIIEARIKLEEAQKEKRRIYRAGVGWVYETDQSKIEEAQKELEEVEREKNVSRLDKQIDLLTDLKDEVANIASPTRKELESQWESLTKAFDIDTNGSIPSILNSLATTWSGLSEKWGIMAKEILGYDVEAVETAKKNISNAWGEGDNSLDALYKKATGENANIEDINKFNSYFESFIKQIENADNMGIPITKDSLGSYELGGYKIEDILSHRNDIHQPVKTTFATEAGNLVTDGSMLSSMDENYGWIFGDLQGGGEGGKYIDSEGKQYSIDDLNIKNKNGDVIKPEDFNDFSEYIKALVTTDEFKNNFPNGIIFHGAAGKSEFAYLDKYGYLYKLDLEKIKEEEKEENPKSTQGYFKKYEKGITLTFNDKKYELLKDVYYNAGGKYYYDNGKWNRITGYTYDGMQSILKEIVNKNAMGTLNLQSSGFNLINEYGPEALITPQGTLTALPAHTGIIPADITKNLWSLGELAPSILSALQMNIPYVPITGFIGGGLDESLNISNLTMHVNSSGTFDAKQFVQSLKEQAALTRNK